MERYKKALKEFEEERVEKAKGLKSEVAKRIAKFRREQKEVTESILSERQ